MSGESSITANISTPMLEKLRGDFAVKAGLIENRGEYAQVWRGLEKLAEDGLRARGVLPRENGGTNE